ncbi:MAG: hypothetical protein GY749_24725 [Desulfobacteraceae bacterium]|nr:hypothetical protein [Desulfobacteraceae bacterium]
MKYFSFKILILCMLLPPVLYVFSVQYLLQKIYIDNHLKNRFASEIEDIYIGDTRLLFEGNMRLKDAVKNNIEMWQNSKHLLSWGIKANVTVITKKGTIVYPEVFEEQPDPLSQADSTQIAADNYNLMNEGFVINVNLKLEHNTLISNTILGLYIFLFLLVLAFYYRSGVKKAANEELKKSRELDRLLELEKVHNERLKSLEQERENLHSSYETMKTTLKKEKTKASKNEDDMFEEIVALEENINQNLTLQKEREDEINDLKEKIKRLEKGKLKDTRQSDIIKKRFTTLYKNISVNDRAVNGYADLEDDMKIKCEEIIHQMNDNSGLVTIKRKVFGKKGRETVLEVLFAYRGRLYFRKIKDNRIEVLTIGTKNTQLKDLEFLDNVSPV